MTRLISITLIVLFIFSELRGADKPSQNQNNSQSFSTAAYSTNYSRNGFFSHTEVNLAFGLGETTSSYSQRFFGGTTMAGYHLNSYFFSGLGAGILDYESGVLAPVFAHVRYNFTDRPVTPFLCADGGMLFKISGEEMDPGYYISAGGGFSIKTSRDRIFTASTNLHTQWNGGNARQTFLNFKIGFLIK